MRRDRDPERGELRELLLRENEARLCGEVSRAIRPFRTRRRIALHDLAKLELRHGSGGVTIERNAIHGSDAEDTARFELSYFFAGYELGK